MNTKQKILDAALSLFSIKGYTAVYVGDIAGAVGIKTPSLYKHFKSKQDIFDSILEEMKTRYQRQALSLNMDGNNPVMDANIFASTSEDTLVEMGITLFKYYLHDDYACKFRKMLTIEQFNNQALAQLYSQKYVDEPLSYQSTLLSLIINMGELKDFNTNIMALHFYAPIYLLLTICDRHPDKEGEALLTIKNHIRQFRLIYGKEIQ